MIDINDFPLPIMNEDCMSSEIINQRVCKAVDIVIYGAGVNGIAALVRLNKQGISPKAFVDANPAGKELLGLPIISLPELSGLVKNTLFVITPIYGSIDIERILLKNGFENYVFVQENIESHFRHKGYCSDYESKALIIDQSKNMIDNVRDNLSDEHSKEVLNAELNLWAEGNADECRKIAKNEDELFFPKDIFNFTDREVFVECGVYDGKTIMRFSKCVNGKYFHIYGLEPDKTAYEISKAYLKTLFNHNVTLIKKGASNFEGIVKFAGDATPGSRICDDGKVEISVNKLDNLINEHSPTFIKMNIEGAELSALQGAVGHLSEYPKLAISIDHKLADLWEIPGFLMTNFPKYKLYMRKHGWLWGTVLYAVKGEEKFETTTISSNTKNGTKS